MAGDWIKMRVGLHNGDPHVVCIMSALHADILRTDCIRNAGRFATVGALHALWCVFDQYSVDGKISYTPTSMDAFLGWDGFTQAVIDAGWLEFDGVNTLIMNNPQTHNGQSAKRRAVENRRKHNVRTAADTMRTPRGQKAPQEQEQDKILTTLSLEHEPKVKGFIRPTLEEIRREVAARGNKIDPERFFNHYESNGWKVGKVGMVKWKAAIATWETQEKSSNSKTRRSVPTDNGLDKKREAMERLRK